MAFGVQPSDCSPAIITIAESHVYALISDGADPAVDRNNGGEYSNSPTDLDGDGQVDTYGEATAVNVSNVFVALRGIVTSNDQLLVFTTDHGGPTEGGGEWDVELNLWNAQVLRDRDMKALTTNFPCPVLFVMEQCYSGGFTDDLNQPNRVIATAAQYNESSYAGDTAPDYDQWCYYWTAAVRGFYPGTNPWDDAGACNADANGDGYVSFQEASDFAYANKYVDDHPMYGAKPERLGNRLFVTQPPAGAIGPDRFVFDPLPSLQAAGRPFAVHVTAQNVLDSISTNPIARATLTVKRTDVHAGTNSGAWHYPVGCYYEDNRYQVIYTAAEIGGARTFNTLALYLEVLPGQTLNAWTLRMKHTSLSTYPAVASWESNGWTTVYQNDETLDATGWCVFNFTTAFPYCGTSNLMIDFSFNNSDYSSDGQCRFSTCPALRGISARSDSEDGDPLDWHGTTPPPGVSNRVPCIVLSSAGPFPAMMPTILSNFVGGAWTGLVTILDQGTSLCLQAALTNGLGSGLSDSFDVRDYLFTLKKPLPKAAAKHMAIPWESGTGRFYRLEVSTNLYMGFSAATNNLPATPPLNVYTDTVVRPGPVFYRVMEQ